MALDTYSNLKTAIQTQMKRGDLSTYVADAITLVEAKVNRALEDPQMEEISTATAAEYMAFPTSYRNLRRIQLNTTHPHPLDLMSPGFASELNVSTGEPMYYTIEDNQIRLIPAPDTTYTVELCYTKYVSALSNSNTTNWLLTTHPDVYLYGGCFECCALLGDMEAAQGYKALYADAVDALIRLEKKQKWGGAPMMIRRA